MEAIHQAIEKSWRLVANRRDQAAPPVKQNEQQPRGIISNGSYLLRVSLLTSALSFHRTRLCLFWQGPRSASGRARATRRNSSFLCSVHKRWCKRSLSCRKRSRFNLQTAIGFS